MTSISLEELEARLYADGSNPVALEAVQTALDLEQECDELVAKHEGHITEAERLECLVSDMRAEIRQAIILLENLDAADQHLEDALAILYEVTDNE